MSATLWLDVEDLFVYARNNSRPSGIQRVAFQIYRTLQEKQDEGWKVRFVVHDTLRNSFRSVSWTEVAAVFDGLTAQRESLPTRVGSVRPEQRSLRRLRRLIHRLPASLRLPLLEAGRAQVSACRAWVKLGAALGNGVRRTAIRRERGVAGFSPRAFAEESGSGDFLVALGGPWSHRGYADMVRVQRARGLRFALLVHDLIPVRHPEWCDRGLVRLFSDWLDSVLPLCDSIFTVSRATASDLIRFARERDIALAPVTTLPMGLGFIGESDADGRTEGLPAPDSYVLFVSTIEARKNHALLFRVWQRLVEDLPRARVPTLVFAGRVGWLVDDLLAQIANTDYLNGHLVIIENPTDSELAALYKGCLFTVFPSLYEGWGLPVTESLAFGKPCVAAERASLPEAGGSLARYFDPDNLHDAYGAIRGVIEDRAGLARWEAQVREEFRPVSWSASVDGLLKTLGNLSVNSCAHAAVTVTTLPVS